MSRVTNMNASRHTYDVLGSVLRRMNQSWHTSKWVMSHILNAWRQLHDAPGLAYASVIAHVWMNQSYLAYFIGSRPLYDGILHTKNTLVLASRHMNQSQHTFEWIASHIWLSHVTRTEARHPKDALRSTLLSNSLHKMRRFVQWRQRKKKKEIQCRHRKWITESRLARTGCSRLGLAIIQPAKMRRFV